MEPWKIKYRMHNPAEGPASLHDARERTAIYSGKLFLAIMICVALAVLWLFAGRDLYYDWLFNKFPRVDVVIHCDTADLLGKDVEALVLYDAVALSPVAHFLQVYQDRPPQRVGGAHVRQAEVETIDSHSVWLENVPRGPIYRIVLIAGDATFHVDVENEKVYQETMSIRASR
jgi:hypothetical protein